MSENEPNTEIPPDPIYARSLSIPILLACLAVVVTTALAVYDEVWSRRPYKAYQQEFVEKYSAYLGRVADSRQGFEKTIRDLDAFKELNDALTEAAAATLEEAKAIDRAVKNVSRRIRSLNGALKKHNSQIAAFNFTAEQDVHHAEGGADVVVKEHADVRDLMQKIEAVLARSVEYEWEERSGEGFETKTDDGTVAELQARVRELRDEKTALQQQLAVATKPRSEAQKGVNAWLAANLGNVALWLGENDDDAVTQAIGRKVAEVGAAGYLNDYTTSLDSASLRRLQESVEEDAPLFGQAWLGGDINEIYIAHANNWVDRCETCHLGTRSPVPITAADVPGDEGHERLFVSHPNRELLDIHAPDDFGCSLCHGGNGVAITSEHLAHGENKHWLYRLHPPENVEAGCLQCHGDDWQLDHGDRINEGRDLFVRHGCWGCHEYQGIDAEEGLARETAKRLSEMQAEIDAKIRRQKNL